MKNSLKTRELITLIKLRNRLVHHEGDHVIGTFDKAHSRVHRKNPD